MEAMSEIVRRAAEHWADVAPLLTPPRSDADYDQLVAALDELLDAGADDEAHPLALLAALIGNRIEAYDEERHPMPKVEGADLLRYLMDEHGLAQSDLPEVGPQSVISAILSGKRAINGRQAVALGQRFAVESGAFLSAAVMVRREPARPAARAPRARIRRPAAGRPAWGTQRAQAKTERASASASGASRAAAKPDAVKSSRTSAGKAGLATVAQSSRTGATNKTGTVGRKTRRAAKKSGPRASRKRGPDRSPRTR
jgi:HTH-type transcriptional regulator/antitoxin HigA